MEGSLSIFKALSDKTRLSIVELLLDGEKCVCEIFPHVGRTQSTVSIHLGKLETAGMLSSRREGKRVLYSIANPDVCKILNVSQHSTGKALKRNALKRHKVK